MKYKIFPTILMVTKYSLYVFSVLIITMSSMLAESVSGQVKSIREVVIEIDHSSERLDQVLKNIEDKTDFRFFYTDKSIKKNTEISLLNTKGTVADYLMEISSQVGIHFRQVNTTISISRQQNESHSNEVEVVIDEQINVTGQITDENGEGLPGATVLEKGTSNGTVTDIDGMYNLSVGPDATLTVSFVGYETMEIPVNDRSVVDIELTADISALEEVVIVGYGSVKKSDLTGSVSQVKSEELQAVPVYNIEQALKGRAAGVRVTQNSGAPGGRMEVRIRGSNSMIGNNQPLYVVDGFPITGGIDFLNPADIESIDILKDASATAIYGSRGANGVVIITSKRGKSQDSKIEVSTFFGVQQDVNRYELLDAREYAIVANELLENGGQAPFFDVDAIDGSGTDWQDQIFRLAPIQNHTISLTGGSDKTRYSVSGNYFNQDGIIINSGAKKGTFRLNLDHDAKTWLKISTNLNLSRRDIRTVPVDNGNYGGGSILAAATSAAPTLPVYDSNGLPTRVGEEYIWGEATMQNPMIYTEPFKQRAYSNSLVGNINFQVKFSDNLSFKTLYGIEYENFNRENFSPIIYNNDRGFASEGNSYMNSLLNENLLTYNQSFGSIHDLTVIAGFTNQESFTKYSTISVTGFANNTTENFDLSSAETINTPVSGNEDWRLLSWLGRANYTLADKYLFTVSVRADGSSRFGNDNKWGIFPSGAFAWRVSDELFMESITSISELKLRTSYGLTGNTALNPYQSLNRLSSVTTIFSNQTNVVGYVPSSLANTDLKWETTAQFDIGLDLNFFENRLRFTLDYYKKNTTNLLASVPLPPSMGFGSILKNIGEIENKGFEFLVAADIIDRQFKWSLSANISTNKNKIVELSEGNDILGNELNLFRSSMNIARVGEPFGSIYGLVESGLDNNGYITYVDTDGDGTINSLDRVIIGNPYPDFIYGLNNSFSFKNFDLNFFIEGVQGNDIFWATAGTHLNSFQRGNNQFADLIGNYWTEENPDPNAKYPVISPSTLIDVSDRFIKDGSYIRLKAFKIGYNIPLKKIGISSIQQFQIYISGNNLFTITNYPGPDPEANTTGTDSQSVGDRLRVGIDQSAYPSARVYASGIRLTF